MDAFFVVPDSLRKGRTPNGCTLKVRKLGDIYWDGNREKWMECKVIYADSDSDNKYLCLEWKENEEMDAVAKLVYYQDDPTHRYATKLKCGKYLIEYEEEERKGFWHNYFIEEETFLSHYSTVKPEAPIDITKPLYEKGFGKDVVYYATKLPHTGEIVLEWKDKKTGRWVSCSGYTIDVIQRDFENAETLEKEGE